MNKKWQQNTLIGLMVSSFILMFNTKYLRAPGDYLLEFMGLKSWTGDMSGTHLTVIYFGIIFFISLFLIEKYLINQSKLKWRRVITILVLSIALYVSTVGTIVQIAMRNSDTLTSIEYLSDSGHLNFSKDDGEYTRFNTVFELSNKSRDSRVFFVDLHSSWRRADGQSSIKILDKNGDRALFELKGDESKLFDLDESEFILKDDEAFGSYSTSGILDEIILTDPSGYSVLLEYDRSYSLRINR
jgi:hypothetical protein